MATSLQIAVEDGPVRVVRLVGELDVDSGRRCRAALDLAISSALQPTVIVDLSELSFCDSSGVRILLALHRLAADAGRELWIRDVMPSVALVLNLTGADRVLVAAADREAP